ncbi:MAG: type II toxin-antitoxin system RelE family toxin [Myxococcota bacterium]
MTFHIEVEERAVRELLDLPKEASQRIRSTISRLAQSSRPPGAKKLTGRGGYRVRVGDYRILYEIDDASKLVRIYKVGHRKDVYR